MNISLLALGLRDFIVHKPVWINLVTPQQIYKFICVRRATHSAELSVVVELVAVDEVLP